MAKARRSRSKGEAAKLEMTPMIDVVFQLLIFFIVTLKPEDIFSHLDVSRPAPDPTAKPEEQVQDLLTILVYDPRTEGGGEGFSMNGRKVSLREVERQMAIQAKYSKNISVVIKCSQNSLHGDLVRLLDKCAKLGLKNLSVFSM